MSALPGLDFDTSALRDALNQLPDRVNNRIAKRAVDAGGAVIEDAARDEAPVGETGNLKRSIGRNTVVYRESDTAVSVVGARYRGPDGVGQHHHLVHEGHIAADGSFVPGNPYLTRARNRSAAAAQAAVAEELNAGIQREVAKL